MSKILKTSYAFIHGRAVFEVAPMLCQNGLIIHPKKKEKEESKVRLYMPAHAVGRSIQSMMIDYHINW